MTAAPKPKPCPFCGENQTVENIDPRYIIECNNPDCMVIVRVWDYTEADALAAWNRREGGGE